MPVPLMREYLVVRTRKETPTTTTLTVAFPDGSFPAYIPGQYLQVYFCDAASTRGKAYSISSGPRERGLAITVRAVGEFSHRLCAMKPGDTFLASNPQGNFYPELAETPLVMIAGGIGVTPFRSIIFDSAYQTQSPNIYLFYSSPTVEDVLFEHEFYMLTKKFENVQVKKYITRESLTAPLSLVRYITSQEILRTITDSFHSEFLISGPTSFVREQRNGLIKAGISESQIRTEVCV